jgi:hypothetical protein
LSPRDLLLDAFERLPDLVHSAVEGLSEEELHARLDPEANHIAWLIWHLARVQDAQVAQIARAKQVWTEEGWSRRWQLPFDDRDTGYGHGPNDVAATTGDAELLLGYFDAVHARTIEFLRSFDEADLERVLDRRWDQPVTVGVRLVSIAGDGFEHGAEANFVRGIIDRRAGR